MYMKECVYFMPNLIYVKYYQQTCFKELFNLVLYFLYALTNLME